MESIVSAFIIITIILFATLTLFHATITSQDLLRASRSEMEARLAEQTHTDLTLVNTETKSSGAVVELTLRNDGDTRLADFDAWDVIAQTYSASGNYGIAWFPYVNGEPANNEWTNAGIYLDAATLTPEVFEPNILNPGEEIVVRLKVSPPVGPGTTNMATISTWNGVNTAVLFSR